MFRSFAVLLMIATVVSSLSTWRTCEEEDEEHYPQDCCIGCCTENSDCAQFGDCYRCRDGDCVLKECGTCTLPRGATKTLDGCEGGEVCQPATKMCGPPPPQSGPPPPQSGPPPPQSCPEEGDDEIYPQNCCIGCCFENPDYCAQFGDCYRCGDSEENGGDCVLKECGECTLPGGAMIELDGCEGTEECGGDTKMCVEGEGEGPSCPEEDDEEIYPGECCIDCCTENSDCAQFGDCFKCRISASAEAGNDGDCVLKCGSGLSGTCELPGGEEHTLGVCSAEGESIIGVFETVDWIYVGCVVLIGLLIVNILLLTYSNCKSKRSGSKYAKVAFVDTSDEEAAQLKQ